MGPDDNIACSTRAPEPRYPRATLRMRVDAAHIEVAFNDPAYNAYASIQLEGTPDEVEGKLVEALRQVRELKTRAGL